ncbi:hypothetical protein FPHYL_5009 [Fusarium phyllophilum]|uniref:Vault poly n=1 Tax=Fusarium phyllophilum TaxID=47803 RepID=A0A8H5NEL8_9HYPO|nr:hypothetical protein FPHYL_5009 [Fusarium phyllophilum]
MATRHVFTQRLKSGVIFSAPGNLLAMPEGGWGDDTPITRQKKPKRKVQSRGLDHFSHWVAKVTPYDEPYENIDSFAPGNDTRGIEDEYRPYSVSPYLDAEVETAAAKIPEVTLSLPMLNVSLTATVDGTVAHTELVQKFHNPSDIIIDAAKHVFPLYDGAVITSFECTIGDERRVRGVVKPKVQARKEFEEAVRDKVAAPALLEEHTPEIFETSLGNIPANTTVEIKITYVQELKVVMMESEATEGVALTVPMSIAPRYSKAPIEWEPASKLPEEKLDIWIKVLDNGKVNHEGCDEESGHLLQFEGSKPIEYSNLSEKDAAPKTYYVWHHVSEPAVLRKDFVFVVQMNEGHHIKSRAIACPADDKGLAAMMVNIRPNDLFRNAIIPQSFTGEILFLLDQSGSMGWTNGSPDYGRRRARARKIDVMREAMLLALSGIPSTCVFNVISWGSATMGLWETSRPHTKENVKEAKSYVSQVEADMGGTDLLRALESVVKRRVQDRGSTQIIILTDGELEPEDSIQFIWKKRQLFGDSIRFFALGIGDEVSHRLVESIAECGGGYSDVVHTTQTPRWHDRLNRLLKSALEPNSWSCNIDLGSGFERKSLVDYKLEQQTTAESDQTPYIQGPFPISSLHPFSFASISFLVDLRHGGELPKTATITTTTAGAKKKTYQLPVERVSGNDGTIHRLVAKSVLLDLQDQIKRVTTETQIAKANAESIGTMYSITSKWTSFVAISENQPTQTVEEQKMNHYKALFDEIDIDELLNNVSEDESSSSGSYSLYGSGIPQGPGIKGNDFSPSFNYPMIPADPLTTGRVLESASRIPISAPMPKPCPPARPPAGMSLPPYSMGGSRDGRSDLRQCSLESDDDEPEALHPTSPPVVQEMSDPVQIKVKGYVDRTTGRNLGVRSNSASGPRPWEIQDSSDSRAQATSVDDDVRLPTRERVLDDSSPAFVGADFPLYPNDSDWLEAQTLGVMRAATVDDSQSDLPPPMTEFAQAHEVAAFAAKPPSNESYGQEAPKPRSFFSYLPAGSHRPRRLKVNASEANSDDNTAQNYQPYHSIQSAPLSSRPSADEDGQPASSGPYAPYGPPVPPRVFLRPKSIATSESLSERVHRRKESAQAYVPDEPMVPPSANRGFGIPAGIIKQGGPHEADDDGTGKRTEASEGKEVVDHTLELTDSKDAVPPHGVAYSPTEDPLASRQWYDLARKRRQSAIYVTNLNPRETSCYSDDESQQAISPKPSSRPPRSMLQDRLDSSSKVGIPPRAYKLPTVTSSQEAEVVECTPATANTSDSSVPDLPSSMPKDTPIHEFWGPAPAEAGSDGSRNSAAGTEYVFIHPRHMSLNPMPRARCSSLDGDASLDVSATERLQSPFAYRRPGQAPLSQASSQLNEYSSSGSTPQIQRGTVPGGPKFPTYQAMPIPNTRAHPFFDDIGRSAKQRRGASKCWESDYDSDDSSMSRGISESSSSQSNVYGPLDWQFAMECQDGQGLFDVGEKRPSLHLHFCSETVTKLGPKISELLHNSTTPEQESYDVSARLLDTLMMIECYKTHRAQEEDTWDLMMERAWDAVISVLGLSDEEETLEELAGQLRGAMMHAHYVAATGVKDSEKDDISMETVRCPFCGVFWLTSRRFFCPFDHESGHVDEFTSWDDFWKHQVDQGHLVCPREVID